LILSANSSDGKSLSIMAGLLWYIMAGLLWSGNFGEQLLSAEAGSTECVLPLSEGFAVGRGRSTRAESR
jgi:hypothetical protein